MAATVGRILEVLEGIAPLALAEEWDNAGLLAGSRASQVERILCALDFTQAVLEEAVARDVQLIVTHHPILFQPRRNLCEDDAEGKLLCALVRAGIALIAMHTNFDNACPGVNDGLAEALGLSEVLPLPHGMRIGKVKPQSLKRFAEDVSKRLGGAVRAYGDQARVVSRVAVMGGAGEDYAEEARLAQADVYLTGEMAYHKALSAVEGGMCVLEAGHAATEKPAISLLCGGLQNALNDVQYNIHVLHSEAELFL